MVPRAFLLVLPMSPHARTSPHVAGVPAGANTGVSQGLSLPQRSVTRH